MPRIFVIDRESVSKMLFTLKKTWNRFIKSVIRNQKIPKYSALPHGHALIISFVSKMPH